jgi:hypothetical protein
VTGSARVQRGHDEVSLAPGEIAVLEAGSDWSLEADDETAVLTTLAWPEEKAGV